MNILHRITFLTFVVISIFIPIDSLGDTNAGADVATLRALELKVDASAMYSSQLLNNYEKRLSEVDSRLQSDITRNDDSLKELVVVKNRDQVAIFKAQIDAIDARLSEQTAMSLKYTDNQIKHLHELCKTVTWVVAIFFAILTFFGQRTVISWVKKTIEYRVSKVLTANYIGKLIKEKGEQPINDLVRELETRAKASLATIENLRTEYEKRLVEIQNKGELLPSLGIRNKEDKADLEKFVEQLTKLKTKKEYSFDDWIALLRTQLENEQFMDAVDSASNAILIKSNDPNVFFWRAVAYIKLEKPDLAENDLQVTFALSPKNPHAIGLRGLINFQAGRVKEAVADYEEACANIVDNLEHKLNLIEAYLLLENTKLGLERLEGVKVESLSPKDQVIYYYLKASLELIGSLDAKESIVHLKAVLSKAQKTSWSFCEVKSWLGTRPVDSSGTAGVRELVELIELENIKKPSGNPSTSAQ
jgi:tetratricopeptide (TPR) repeat protein